MNLLGYLGPEGTHSEEAARYFLHVLAREKCDLQPLDDILSALRAVEEGSLDAALVPVENSLEGAVNITLDALAQNDALTVVQELVWPVHNFLLAKKNTQDIRAIYSHAQPLAQCRQYLRTHYPQARLLAAPSTAEAARLVSGSRMDDGLAAISTARAGKLYGLQIIARAIEDSPRNCTRFFLIQRRDEVSTLAMPVESALQETLLLLAQIDGQRAGSLCAMLMEFAQRDLNLTRIESRPARTKLGEYLFFLDLDVKGQNENLEAALAAVRPQCQNLRLLGRFPVAVADKL